MPCGAGEHTGRPAWGGRARHASGTGAVQVGLSSTFCRFSVALQWAQRRRWGRGPPVPPSPGCFWGSPPLSLSAATRLPPPTHPMRACRLGVDGAALQEVRGLRARFARLRERQQLLERDNAALRAEVAGLRASLNNLTGGQRRLEIEVGGWLKTVALKLWAANL